MDWIHVNINIYLFILHKQIISKTIFETKAIIFYIGIVGENHFKRKDHFALKKRVAINSTK